VVKHAVENASVLLMDVRIDKGMQHFNQLGELLFSVPDQLRGWSVKVSATGAHFKPNVRTVQTTERGWLGDAVAV
jgi:hypothetical protein